MSLSAELKRVAYEYELTTDEVLSNSRAPTAVAARGELIRRLRHHYSPYELQQLLGFSLASISRYSGGGRAYP